MNADMLALNALALVGLVREEVPFTVGLHLAKIDRQQLEHLTIALAAMVPDDRPLSELLAWTDARIPEKSREKHNRIRREKRAAAREAGDPAYLAARARATAAERERVARKRAA